MKITTIAKKYGTQAKCLSYMEKLRWGKTVKCPYCGSEKNKRYKNQKNRHKCYDCKRSFSVLIDTIFEDTRLPLPDWFMIIGLMLNSKSGIASKEIQRNLGVTYKTAFYTSMRVRCGMLVEDSYLHGIVEADESYFGGKARRKSVNPKYLDKSEANLSTSSPKRGRGTNKISVAGMVERDGKVKTKVIEKLTKRNLLAFLKKTVDTNDSLLMTDGFRSYKEFDKHVERMVIIHKKQFSKGIVHVNTIEGFWSYVKNGIRGSYKSISPKYLPLYLIEYEWKYNNRKYKGDMFEKYLKNALSHEKDTAYWKISTPEKVKEVIYEK